MAAWFFVEDILTESPSEKDLMEIVTLPKIATGGSFKVPSVWGRASFSTTRHWNVVKLCHHPQQVPRVRANTRKKLIRPTNTPDFEVEVKLKLPRFFIKFLVEIVSFASM